MSTVNILEAKTHLSRLVAEIESGATAEVVIARNGRPVARLVGLSASPAGKRIGVARGCFEAPEPDAALDEEVARLLLGDDR